MQIELRLAKEFPKTFNERVLSALVLNVLKKYAKRIEEDYQTILADWNHDVTPDIEMKYEGNEARVVVTIDDEIYGYVSGGTSVRYATMSRDFSPKSIPGWIGSTAGSGELLFVNRNYPRPGIEAREFEQAIKDKWKESFSSDISLAVLKAIAIGMKPK